MQIRYWQLIYKLVKYWIQAKLRYDILTYCADMLYTCLSCSLEPHCASCQSTNDVFNTHWMCLKGTKTIKIKFRKDWLLNKNSRVFDIFWQKVRSFYLYSAFSATRQFKVLTELDPGWLCQRYQYLLTDWAVRAKLYRNIQVNIKLQIWDVQTNNAGEMLLKPTWLLELLTPKPADHRCATPHLRINSF